MKFKVIFWLAIMNILCACQAQAQEVTLSENDYKELKTSYKGAKAIYEFSKAQRDFASYIEADKSTSLQAIISTYHELKQAWETIQELRGFSVSGKEAVEFTVNLETVQALKESAIGITMKLDKFLTEHIQNLNEKHLIEELIQYYDTLVRSGHEQYRDRLLELNAKKQEMKAPPKVKSYPKTPEDLFARYKGCLPCDEFYRSSEGANHHIDYYKDLMRLEQFPGLLDRMKSLMLTQTVTNDMGSGGECDFCFNNALVDKLDELCHLQRNQCSFEYRKAYGKVVDQIIGLIIDQNDYAHNDFSRTRLGRIRALKKRNRSENQPQKIGLPGQ